MLTFKLTERNWKSAYIEISVGTGVEICRSLCQEEHMCSMRYMKLTAKIEDSESVYLEAAKEGMR